MAILTVCQNTFQSIADTELEAEALRQEIHECYTEISKTSEEIQATAAETYIAKTELETIQQDFQSSITQSASEIRMDFTTSLSEITDQVATNQTLLEEYIRFEAPLSSSAKLETPSPPSSPMSSWLFSKTASPSHIFQTSLW